VGLGVNPQLNLVCRQRSRSAVAGGAVDAGTAGLFDTVRDVGAVRNAGAGEVGSSDAGAVRDGGAGEVGAEELLVAGSAFPGGTGRASHVRPGSVRRAATTGPGWVVLRWWFRRSYRLFLPVVPMEQGNVHCGRSHVMGVPGKAGTVRNGQGEKGSVKKAE
jgi:hypothetical protein